MSVELRKMSRVWISPRTSTKQDPLSCNDFTNIEEVEIMYIEETKLCQ